MKKVKEKIIENLLKFSGLISILTTIGILYVLISESLSFFRNVSVIEFLTAKQWTPLFSEKHYGILPLLSGTLLTTIIAIMIALPLGLVIAIYLNEYAPKSFRKSIKPILEILAAIPTVVYGFFALMVITPFLQQLIPSLSGFNSLSPGIVMGIMITPMISSLSEDALYAVPYSLREASYGMGATRFQTTFRVL
ncbi:MAG: phosphate ABC transporter permease subunit PstC, partial [Sphingobacteriales bacterium]|nr:phosphate ABC transporter permease subunit PstC [Sphingobacteriales bacterium]